MPRFDVVGVIVSDRQTAVDFYRRLGLEFPEDLDPMGHGHVEAPLRRPAVHSRVTEGGAAGYKEPWDAFWGQRYAQVKDPDGNVIDLFAPLG